MKKQIEGRLVLQDKPKLPKNKDYVLGYGIVSLFKYMNKTLKKYRCRWIKTIAGHNYYCGTMTVAAPNMDIAIEKASAIKGYKPTVTQRV